MAADLADLHEQLLAAAAEFATDASPYEEVLAGMATDVSRASREPVEIFPVCHHSPSSAIHMVRRLRSNPPKVIFLELCEDFDSRLDELADCKLPVALQGFAGELDGFAPESAPLSVVCPLTEMSAEYQAIAYVSTHPDTVLVPVDRSVDVLFQWAAAQADLDAVEGKTAQGKTAQGKTAQGRAAESAPDDDEQQRLHGKAVGVEVGSVMPSYPAFVEALCANARVANFQEWWNLYVEQPTITADYDTYRNVLFLVGSLIRRLGVRERELEKDRQRERFMWARMRDYLAEHKLDPTDAIYVCGAAHSASDIDGFGYAGVDDSAQAVPPRTPTKWHYGFIPSSHRAIEQQFAHPLGTLTLAEANWKKATKSLRLKPFAVGEQYKPGRTKPIEPDDADISQLLARPHSMAEQDHSQLLGWCTGIVGLARRNRYLASTADAIAIYEHVMLLARLRGRSAPTAFDFVDAAVTCLEKAEVPGRKNIADLCGALLGGDRIGQVGYSSLPPLVQDIFDRLKPAGVEQGSTRVVRWLVNFDDQPEMRPVSDLLWRLNWMLPGTKVARPIMGTRGLGVEARQESWDIKLGGTEQRHVIELAYEGVTTEQVLERRIHLAAFGDEATAAKALSAVEASIVLLSSPRLTADVGRRSVELLTSERDGRAAHDIFARARALTQYYREFAAGLPDWLENFVSTGYRHYISLLPHAFGDRGTSPDEVAAMAGFVFTLEGLALSLGCERSELEVAIGQAKDLCDDPNKIGLLWVAEWLIDRRTSGEVRAAFGAILDQPHTRDAFPKYLGGLLLAIGLSPRVATIAAELLGRAFDELPDSILLPWLPGLFHSLSSRRRELGQLAAEAERMLPASLADLDTWAPSWQASAEATPASAPPSPASASSPDTAGALAVAQMLDAHRSTLDALTNGTDGTWSKLEPLRAGEAAKPNEAPRDSAAYSHPELVASLLAMFPSTIEALTR